MTLALLLIIPIVIAWMTKWWFVHEVTWKELGTQLGAQTVLIGVVVGLSSITIGCFDTYDVYGMSGRVTGRTSYKVSCSHSYSCHCTTHCSGTGSRRSCHTICQTCYEHSFDMNWDVTTTLGPVSIDRVDRQGLKTPPRWNESYKNEPVTMFYSYTNWIKANPSTLFRYAGQAEQFKHIQSSFAYPKVQRYYRINRVLGALPKNWSEPLEHFNADRGSVQVNLIGVTDPHQEYAVRQWWLGGKKNDILVFLQIADGKVNWASVVAWTDNPLFAIRLRDRLKGSRAEIFDILYHVGEEIKGFVPKNPEDFQYLKDDFQHGKAWWIVMVLLSIVVSVAISFITVTEDLYNEDRTHYRGWNHSGSWRPRW